VQLTTTGGTVSYAYQWNNGATTQNRTNMVAGSYSITITDARSCSVSTSVVITQSLAVSLSFSKVNPLCNGDANGANDLTENGGMPPMSY
jgi:hypothetical protein